MQTLNCLDCRGRISSKMLEAPRKLQSRDVLFSSAPTKNAPSRTCAVSSRARARKSISPKTGEKDRARGKCINATHIAGTFGTFRDHLCIIGIQGIHAHTSIPSAKMLAFQHQIFSYPPCKRVLSTQTDVGNVVSPNVTIL